MIYSLITTLEAHGNPGSELITDGIKHWIKNNDPDATFTYIEMCKPDPEGWENAKKADKLVFCGNPRFNTTENKVWWDWDIWKCIFRSGKPFIDAWAGSAVPHWNISTPEKMAKQLLTIKKNVEVLKTHESRAEMIIARDKTTFLLCKEFNPNTVLLSCSSQYAKYENNITSGSKDYNAICLRKMPGDEWILKKVLALKAKIEPCIVMCHSYNDLEWAKELNPVVINDPKKLLDFYSHVNKLHCFRLHGSIPAYTLGADVVYYYNDSRKDTCSYFPIRTVPYTQFPIDL